MNGDLNDLNERFYALYGRLYENSELLPREQQDYTAKRLLEEYKAEYELLAMRERAERAREMYALKLKYAELVPRVRRPFPWFRRKYNTAAQLIAREVSAQVESIWIEQEEKIAEQERANAPQKDEPLWTSGEVCSLLRCLAVMYGHTPPEIAQRTPEKGEEKKEEQTPEEAPEGPQKDAEAGEDADGGSSV